MQVMFELCLKVLTCFIEHSERGHKWGYLEYIHSFIHSFIRSFVLQCPNGFIFEVDGPRVARAITCSACEKKMCHKCKKPVSIKMQQ